MTNAELIAKIKAEIERNRQAIRVLNEHTAPEQMSKTCAIFQYSDTILSALLSFLSTLESEKPMNFGEALDKEIAEYFPESAFCTGWNYDDMEGIARHFAKWGADHTPLPEDTVLFNKGVEEGKRLMMEDAVKWLVDDDYHEATEKGRFILGSVGIGYNGYYIPYSDLLKLPKEDEK